MDSNTPFPDPREQDIMAGERRISRPDASLPDWEVPDSTYRPVPIVWFTAALIGQMVTVFILFMLLIDQHGAVTIVFCGLASGLIGAWTWNRGMKSAAAGWKNATVIMLSANFALVCAGAMNRF